MKKYGLETALGAACEKEIESVLDAHGCDYEKGRTKMGALYSISDGASFVDACASALVSFYKTKDILSVLGEKTDIEFYAVLGILLSTGREAEIEKIGKMLENETAVNLDGLFNFDLAETRADWKDLSALCGRLYSACVEVDDKDRLILYLLDLKENKGSSVRIRKDGLYVNGEKKRMISFFNDEAKDLVTNVFLYRPEEMEVDAGYERAPSVEYFLRRLCRLTTASPVD